MIRPIHYLRRFGLTLSLLLAAQSGAADSVRIMPVGDSDTEGFGGFVSYRYDLWFLLKDAGYDVDFTGRYFLTGGGVNAELYPGYEEFDPNHEGRFGASLADMASAASGMAAANQPDVVLLMGSHDICYSGSGAPTIARFELAKIIDNIRAVDPDVHFLLGQTYAWESPGCDPNAPEIIPDFNAVWAEVARAGGGPLHRL
jgi:hypothetical protein